MEMFFKAVRDFFKSIVHLFNFLIDFINSCKNFLQLIFNSENFTSFPTIFILIITITSVFYIYHLIRGK